MSLFDQLPSMDLSKIKSITSDFKTGRDDVLKSIAGTATSAVDTLTAFRGSLENSINSTLSKLTGNLISISDLNSFIDFSNGKVTLNERALANKISQATGLNITADGNLFQGIAQGIYNDLNRYSNGAIGKIFDANGNVVLLDSMMSGTDYYKISSMVDSYLENMGKERENGYYDHYTVQTMGTELIRQAAVGGNYVDVRSLYDAAPDGDKAAYRDVLANCLKDVGNNGDFRTSAVICEFITPERGRQVVPELIVLLFRAYRVPSYLSLDEYGDEANRLVDFADTFKPGWRITPYFNDEAQLLSMWMQTSSGLYQLFSRSEEYAPMVIMGRNYTQETTMGILKRIHAGLPTVTMGG